MEDSGPFIQTYTGRKFYFLHPEQSDISILDIAHSLSKINRFNGHTDGRFLGHDEDRFYSVAEHSIWVTALVEKALTNSTQGILLNALLHDAQEAYLGDVTTPLKSLLPEYSALEEKTANAISATFKLDKEKQRTIIKAADQAMLWHEMNMFQVETFVDPPAMSSWMKAPPIRGWAHIVAERKFLHLYKYLRGQHRHNGRIEDI